MAREMIFVDWENRTILGECGRERWIEEEVVNHLNGDSDCLEDFLTDKGMSAVDVWLLSDDERARLDDELEEVATEYAVEDFERDFEAFAIADIE